MTTRLTTRREHEAPHFEEVRHAKYASSVETNVDANRRTTRCGTLRPNDCLQRPDVTRNVGSCGRNRRAGRCGTSIQCDPDNAGLTLPAGFCALAVVKNVGRARHMAVRPNGDLYVAIDNSPGTTDGGILALCDADGDGRPEIQERFGDIGGNGIAWSEGQLYFAPNDRVIRYTFTGDELVPTMPPDVIVSGLPVGGDHQRKTVVLDGKGSM